MKNEEDFIWRLVFIHQACANLHFGRAGASYITFFEEKNEKQLTGEKF